MLEPQLIITDSAHKLIVKDKHLYSYLDCKDHV
jgi:hypothetical protein